jgi:CRISPR-associated endonuclease/helicase Cas3
MEYEHAGENYLWAKKKEINGRFYWLPLKVHLQDTMDIAGWLWNHWISSGQRNDLISGMNIHEESCAEALVRFLGGIHDIGKATPAFQREEGFSISPDLNQILMENLERAGFTGISEKDLLPSARATHHSLAGECILSRLGVRKDIASIVGAHHGKPVDSNILCEEQSAYEANYYQNEDHNSLIHRLWEKVQNNIYQWALSESGIYRTENLPELSLPVQVVLSGLLIMADWIASNENYFPLMPIDEMASTESATRFCYGMQKWCRSLPIEIHEPLNVEALYKERFGFAPRQLQKAIFESIQQIEKPGMVIIEAPTGCGKTEAALAAAEQLASKSGRSGLFFGLPTQATSNSMFSRVNAWLKSFSENYSQSASLRLQHGKAALNPLMQELSSQIAEDEGHESTVLVNEWFSGRKTAALDDFVVGTVDNFLLVALKQKHLALRHLGFDKKVVIIDEVHAYDAYMQQYLNEALRWMGAYRVPVILLSATLPAERRKSFIQSYLMGTGLKKREIIAENVNLNTEHYPLLTYTEGSSIRQDVSLSMASHKIIQVKKLQEDRLYVLINDLYQRGGVLGVIVNTVKRAQEITKTCIRLFGEDSVALLHSNFITTDRIEKEKKLESMIGKRANRPKRKIIIGTQVIEQSLDIDFDVLFSDLCPIDLLIQRAGRLHRHDIQRPEHLTTPVIYVMGENDDLSFETGSRFVYGNCLLARTQYYLPDKIHIPEDISPMVQRVYDLEHDNPDFGTTLNEKYRGFEEEFKNKIQNKENKAKSFKIDAPRNQINPDKYNLIGWIRDPDRSETDEKSYAQVRDIEETIEVVAVKRYGTGYGFFHSKNAAEIDISEQIINPSIAKRLSAETLRLPHWIAGASSSEMIEWLEQYNRENLNIWQEQSWLKGSLGIIFNEEGNFQIGDSGLILHYDDIYGLEIIKKETLK